MFEDIIGSKSECEEKCCGGCDPDYGCGCSPESEGSCYAIDDTPSVKEGVAEWWFPPNGMKRHTEANSRLYQPVEDTEANRAFLLRWKQDIEDGIEAPLEYNETLQLIITFGEDLVDEVGIAYTGWEAEDDPDEPELEYGVFDQARSLSIRAARSTMSNIFQQDPELKDAYVANIAMSIYDSLMDAYDFGPNKATREAMAERILKLIFE